MDFRLENYEIILNFQEPFEFPLLPKMVEESW